MKTINYIWVRIDLLMELKQIIMYPVQEIIHTKQSSHKFTQHIILCEYTIFSLNTKGIKLEIECLYTII